MSNSKFLKIGLIYTIGQLLTKAMSFIMIPIYTRELGVVGFGQLSIVDTVMNFVSSFLIISIYSGYIRFYRDYDEENRNSLRNTAITFALVMAAINILIVVLWGRAISNVVFDFGSSYEIFILLIVRSLLAQFITLLMCDYTLNYEAAMSVSISFIQMILDLIFVAYFIMVKKYAIIGIYLGYVCSSTIVLMVLIIKQRRKFKLEFNNSMFRNMIKFSLGLIPCGLSATILDLADRYFLSGYKGFTQTGIYSMGYKIGMLIDPLFISPFKSIFTTYKFEVWKNDDGKNKMKEMFIGYHVIGCFIILSLYVFSKLIIMILSSNEYLAAANLVPIILYSYFLYGENEFFSIGIQIRNKTYLTSIIMLVGGSINIVLNMMLIPKYGMNGAAIATLISYIAINFINIKVSKGYYKIDYDFKKGYMIDSVLIGLCFINYIFTSKFSNILIEIGLGIILMGAYILIMIILRVLRVDMIKNLLKKNSGKGE